MLTAKFDSLLNEFGPESEVFSALAATQFPEAHRNRLLDAYAASTVFRYCQAVQQFSKTVATLGFALPELTVPQLVDCLASMTHSRAQTIRRYVGEFHLEGFEMVSQDCKCSLFGDSVLTIGRQFLEGAFDFR